ncbi:MAG: HD domain-containing protein, partial [Pseudonocardiaceae bacterium]
EAERIAGAFGADGTELVAAAWLHDVGYAPDLAVTGLHALDGARFLRAEGWPARVCDLVAHHSCAVREAELRGLSAELAEFTDEASPVRDALWYCDMTTGPSGDRVSVEERLAEITERYGRGDVVTRFVELARDELVGAVERTRARLRAAGLADYPM